MSVTTVAFLSSNIHVYRIPRCYEGSGYSFSELQDTHLMLEEVNGNATDAVRKQ
jgi:hypothetical protein